MSNCINVSCVMAGPFSALGRDGNIDIFQRLSNQTAAKEAKFVLFRDVNELEMIRGTPRKINGWNIIMKVWKIIFLSKWMICRFHVNLPGCRLQTPIFWLERKGLTNLNLYLQKKTDVASDHHPSTTVDGSEILHQLIW